MDENKQFLGNKESLYDILNNLNCGRITVDQTYEKIESLIDKERKEIVRSAMNSFMTSLYLDYFYMNDELTVKEIEDRVNKLLTELKIENI